MFPRVKIPKSRHLHDGVYRFRQFASPGVLHVCASCHIQQLTRIVSQRLFAGSIHIDVERVPEAMEPESVTLTADDLVGPWHLAEDEKDNSTAIEALPGAMEFGNSMEITSDGHISWYIGADGGTGTYSLSGDILSADMTNDFDQSSMKMEFTAEKTDDGTFLYTEYKGLLLCWSQGEGETGKDGDDEVEASYPGADVVELVNLRGDTTTVYKLADGTYMDRIERHFSYNGTDTWTDEDGVEWNEVVK